MVLFRFKPPVFRVWPLVSPYSIPSDGWQAPMASWNEVFRFKSSNTKWAHAMYSATSRIKLYSKDEDRYPISHRLHKPNVHSDSRRRREERLYSLSTASTLWAKCRCHWKHRTRAYAVLISWDRRPHLLRLLLSVLALSTITSTVAGTPCIERTTTMGNWFYFSRKQPLSWSRVCNGREPVKNEM